MSSLLTSDALVQKCYTKTPVGINKLVKLNGFNLEYNVPIVELVSGSSNATVIGLTTEIVSASGVVTEVLYKGLVDATGLLPTGTFVNSEIYWDSNTLELTSDTTDYFVGWVSEAFPNQKIYVDILKSSGGGGSGSVDWDDITNKPSTFTPSPHTHLASEITESASRRFLSENDYNRFMNTPIEYNSVVSSDVLDFTTSNRASLVITLFSSLTITDILNPLYYFPHLVVFIQDSSGGRTITLPANVKIPIGETPDTGANKSSFLTLVWNGTEFLGSWKKGW
jgi:hypothetical protein